MKTTLGEKSKLKKKNPFILFSNSCNGLFEEIHIINGLFPPQQFIFDRTPSSSFLQPSNDPKYHLYKSIIQMNKHNYSNCFVGFRGFIKKKHYPLPITTLLNVFTYAQQLSWPLCYLFWGLIHIKLARPPYSDGMSRPIYKLFLFKFIRLFTFKSDIFHKQV